MHYLHYWKSGLEIAIIWYVIYMVLFFVKGTRSEQLLKGVFIIALIFIVTRQLGLDAINWAITRLFPLSVIALAVIFQPELRRALAQLGQFRLHHENVQEIDEICDAALELSAHKRGALIVIEKEVGLKSYIETGTPIDSVIKSDIISTMFLHQSQLHDGAIIIQRGRIAAAGCVLPLPEEAENLPKAFGMRHRAAIGITQETDAACVVVSEESGTISIAFSGRINRYDDKEGIRTDLKKMLYGPIAKKDAAH